MPTINAALGGDVTCASIGGSIRSLASGHQADPAYRATYGHFARVQAHEVIDLRAGPRSVAMRSMPMPTTDQQRGITAMQEVVGGRGAPQECQWCDRDKRASSANDRPEVLTAGFDCSRRSSAAGSREVRGNLAYE